MRKAIVIIFLLTVSFKAFTQDSYITLLNKKTGQIIEQANVHWQIFNTPQKAGYVVADYHGKIKIPLSKGEKIILQATCIGFKPLQDTIVLKENQKLYMQEDVLNIEQITITGTRTTHTLKQSPVLTQLITNNELKNIDAPTITDILQIEMPGVEMGNHGGVPVMNMMGLGVQYSLILINGERISKTLHNSIDYSQINSANIERIEIIRGASSALYGSEAMGGVINIITKNANQKVSVSADIKYQQANENNHSQTDIDNMEDAYAKQFYRNLDKPNLNTNISLGLKHKAFSSMSFFNFKTIDAYILKDTEKEKRYYNNGDITEEEIKETTINGSKNYTINQKFSYKTNKLNCSLSGNYYNNHEYDFSNDAFHNFYQNYNVTSKNSYSINNKKIIAFSHSFDKYQRFNYYEKDNSKTRIHDDISHSTKLNYTYKIGKFNIFREVENLYRSLTTDKFEANKMKTKSTNDIVYVVQTEFMASDKFSIVEGLRVGYHSTFEEHFSPSLTVKYDLGKYFNFRASYSRGFRAPDIKELFMDWNHLGSFQIKGNKNLKPETNNYYSLSTDLLNSNHTFNITLITSYNNVKNKIALLSYDNGKTKKYINYSKSKIFSLETILKWQFTDNFKLKAGYIFLHSENSIKTQKLSNMSPISATGQLEYKFRKNKYSLIANINGKITGEKEAYAIDDNDESLHKDQYYKIKYPMYSLWNIAVNQYYTKHFKLGLGVKNLFNYKAPIVTFDTTRSPGRRFYISLGYEF